MWQPNRSHEPEIIDKGEAFYTPEEYSECLTMLGRINRFLGGFQASKRAFSTLKKKPRSILEVGCGGGYLCQYMQKWYPESDILGVDLSEKAILHAQKAPPQSKGRLSFEVQKEKKLEFSDGSFDIVTTMLVCHHMDDNELVEFLKESYRVCSEAVIINDLQRHFLAYVSYSLITPFAFPNRLIWHDGRLSIRKSFRKSDWHRLLSTAGFGKEDYTLTWNWAFRWTLVLRKR